MSKSYHQQQQQQKQRKKSRSLPPYPSNEKGKVFKYRDSRRPKGGKKGAYRKPRVLSGVPGAVSTNDAIGRTRSGSVAHDPVLIRDAPLNRWIDELAQKSLNLYKANLKNLYRLKTSLTQIQASTPEHPAELLKVRFSPQVLELIDELTLSCIKRDVHNQLQSSLVQIRREKLDEIIKRVDGDSYVHNFRNEALNELSELYSTEEDKKLINYKMACDTIEQVCIKLVDSAKEVRSRIRKENEAVSLNKFLISNSLVPFYMRDSLLSIKKGLKNIDRDLTHMNALLNTIEVKSFASTNHGSKFINLSKATLPSGIESILDLGMNFIFHDKVDQNQLINEFDSVINKLFNISPPLREDTYFKFCAHDKKFNLVHKQVNSSDVTQHKFMLSKFLKENNLILKPADKNLGLVLMDVQWYIQQVYKHLDDTDTYKVVNYLAILHSLPGLEAKLNSIGCFYMFSILGTKEKPKVPKFYVIPKIHKTPLATRPIVPNFDSGGTKVSKWLDEQLKPLLVHYPWIVKGTVDAIQKLEGVTVLFDKPILCSGDIKSLYTSINNKKAMVLIKRCLVKCRHPKKTLIVTLIEWLLDNSYFSFQGSYYKQLKGVPMGTNVAPTFCNLILGEIEWLYTLRYRTELPLGYCRFIDDTFMVMDVSQKYTIVKNFTELFLKELDIEWTWEFGKSIPFLDLELELGKSYKRSFTLDYKLYEKPTNNHQYTHPSSNYPDTYKYGWIFGENVRILRNCKHEKDYVYFIHKFKEHLLLNSYPRSVIDTYCRLNFEDRIYFLSDIKGVNHRRKGKYVGIPHSPCGELILKEIKELLCETNNTKDYSLILNKGQSTQDIANIVNKELL